MESDEQILSSSFSSSSSSSKTRKTEDEPVRRVFHTDSSARVDLEPEIIFGNHSMFEPAGSKIVPARAPG